MASRAQRMTVEEVLELLSDAEEVEEMEVSNEWEDDELDLVDDPDEPIMEGSDDEVSDLGEIDEDEDDDIPVPLVNPPNASPGQLSSSPSLPSQSSSASTSQSPGCAHHPTPTPCSANPSLPAGRLPSNPSLAVGRLPSTPSLPAGRLPSNPSLAMGRLPSHPSLHAGRLPSNPSLAAGLLSSSSSLPSQGSSASTSQSPGHDSSTNPSHPAGRLPSHPSLPDGRLPFNPSLPAGLLPSHPSLPAGRLPSNPSHPAGLLSSSSSLTSQGSSASTSQSPGCDSSTTPTPTTWSSTLKPVTIKPFQSPVGPTAIISTSPLEVYHLFFTDNLREEIVEQTNRYAEQGMEDEQYQRWKKVTVEELEAFLGFYILMAINQLPSIEDYWRRDPTTHYSPIADRMSRDRFREISRYLHFSDNTTLVPRGAPGHNRLGKVRPVLDYLCQQFAEQYQPNRDVAVDEAMIKFQGRSSLKQYMPLKPVKRGIKVWVLGDSMNGYFSRLEVYTGKEGNTVQTGLGARVVKTLTQEIKHKNHHVYFDNFFTTYQLLEDLLAVVIYACGTARSDRRGFPAELRLVKLKTRGDSRVVQKGGVTTCAWMDRKTVMMMSTSTQPSAKGSVLRRQKDGTRITVSCPEPVVVYNQCMGGVDRGDQLRGYYSCRMKSRKFYKYIFFFLFDVAITNAYILQRHFCPIPPHKTIKDFRLHLAKQLIGNYCSRQRPGRVRSAYRPLPLRHFPVRIPSDTQAVKHKRGRCVNCQLKKARTDTTWFCQECSAWLCHSGDASHDCFLLWHTQRRHI